MKVKVRCEGCKGTGKIKMPHNIEGSCFLCKGKGWEEKTIYKGRASNVICWNSSCIHYFEDLCTSEMGGRCILLDNNGKCQNFKKGVNEMYLFPEEE